MIDAITKADRDISTFDCLFLYSDDDLIKGITNFLCAALEMSPIYLTVTMGLTEIKLKDILKNYKNVNNQPRIPPLIIIIKGLMPFQ